MHAACRRRVRVGCCGRVRRALYGRATFAEAVTSLALLAGCRACCRVPPVLAPRSAMAAAVPERRLSALGRSLSGSDTSDGGSFRLGNDAAEAFAAASRAQADAYRMAPSAAAGAAAGDGALARAGGKSKSLEEERSTHPPALRRQQSVPCFPQSPMAQLRVSQGLDRCQHGSSAALQARAFLQSGSSADAGAGSPRSEAHTPPADLVDAAPRGRRCVACVARRGP